MRETLPFGGRRIFNVFVADRLQRFYRRLVPMLPQARVYVDMGCGPGHLATMIAQAKPASDVIGIDADPVQVRFAARNEAPNLRFMQGRSEAMDLADASVDLMVATETFHHWADPAGAIDEIYRVLRPGGQFWVVEGSGDMTQDEMATWLGRRPPRPLAWWIRQVFRRHGYTLPRLETDVVNPLKASRFRHVRLVEDAGWWIVQATRPEST